jgi:hypothetical protein
LAAAAEEIKKAHNFADQQLSRSALRANIIKFTIMELAKYLKKLTKRQENCIIFH